MSESIGIDEGWIEKGWTEEQMMNRIEELDLPVPTLCCLQPYVLNYLQTPNMNSNILKLIEQKKRIKDSNAWIAASNLWTPGKPINIVFSNSTAQEYIKAALLKYAQPHISMPLTFPSSGGDVIINVKTMPSGILGMAAVGKTGNIQTQTIDLSITTMTKGDINSTQKFDWPKYVLLHEFGHCLGLWHEWERERCGKGSTCSESQDIYSVMNYTSNSKNVMDTYSPTDIEWLNKVYGKGPGGGTQQPPQSPQPPGKTTQPKPPGKTTRPKPPGKTTQSPTLGTTQSPTLGTTQPPTLGTTLATNKEQNLNITNQNLSITNQNLNVIIVIVVISILLFGIIVLKQIKK